MKTRIAYLFAGFLAMTLLSCSDDLNYLLPIEKVNVEYRALRPYANGNGQLTDHRGEKGRDHRDDFTYNYTTDFNNYPYPEILEIGKLYVLKHDHESNQCILKFYFGSMPIQDVMDFYDNQYIHISFYSSKGTCQDYIIYSYDYNSDHLLNTGHRLYRIGDPIIIPGSVCEQCSSIYVSLSSKEDENWREHCGWYQPFYSFIYHHWN